MRYALVQNNKIIEGPKNLPKAWNNITGFHHLTDDELRQHGWLPYHNIYLDSLEAHEIYDAPIISIGKESISEVQTKRNKVPLELEKDLFDKKEGIRQERDRLLAETDWMATADCPHDTPEIRIYRQALRDITKQAGFPHSVVWPTK